MMLRSANHSRTRPMYFFASRSAVMNAGNAPANSSSSTSSGQVRASKRSALRVTLHGTPGLAPLTGRTGQQPGGHHLQQLAEGGGEVQAHGGQVRFGGIDRKSTRLNSSHAN